jgi:hypothetical protein
MDEVKTQYGPRKLGKKAWAELQAKAQLRSRQATVYGDRKMGRRRGTGEKKNPFLDELGGRVSITTLEELVTEDPILLDIALETELSHLDRPRKGAIAVLRAAEGVRPGGPRQSVITLLDQLERRIG